MYGANALVGVVNVVTKEAEELCKEKPITAIANTGYGTYNTKYAALTDMLFPGGAETGVPTAPSKNIDIVKMNSKSN